MFDAVYRRLKQCDTSSSFNICSTSTTPPTPPPLHHPHHLHHTADTTHTTSTTLSHLVFMSVSLHSAIYHFTVRAPQGKVLSPTQFQFEIVFWNGITSHNSSPCQILQFFLDKINLEMCGKRNTFVYTNSRQRCPVNCFPKTFEGQWKSSLWRTLLTWILMRGRVRDLAGID